MSFLSSVVSRFGVVRVSGSAGMASSRLKSRRKGGSAGGSRVSESTLSESVLVSDNSEMVGWAAGVRLGARGAASAKTVRAGLVRNMRPIQLISARRHSSNKTVESRLPVFLSFIKYVLAFIYKKYFLD